MVNKIAVDKATKDYWNNYFKEYGKSWTRDIPRRIKSAIRRNQKAANIDGYIAPMANSVSSDDSLSIEAAFVGKIDNQDAKALITAKFDNKGKLEEFEINRIM